MDKKCRRCKVSQAFPEQFRSKQICLRCAPDQDESYFTMAEDRERRLADLAAVLKDVPKAERNWYRTLYRSYGITPQVYQALITRQNGVCAICENLNPGGDRLAVDHDHQTGKVRGLLCHNCNIGLGNFRDSSRMLHKALAYLEKT